MTAWSFVFVILRAMSCLKFAQPQVGHVPVVTCYLVLAFCGCDSSLAELK